MPVYCIGDQPLPVPADVVRVFSRQSSSPQDVQDNSSLSGIKATSLSRYQVYRLHAPEKAWQHSRKAYPAGETAVSLQKLSPNFRICQPRGPTPCLQGCLCGSCQIDSCPQHDCRTVGISTPSSHLAPLRRSANADTCCCNRSSPHICCSTLVETCFFVMHEVVVLHLCIPGESQQWHMTPPSPPLR